MKRKKTARPVKAAEAAPPERAERRAGPEEKRVRRTVTIRLTAVTPLKRSRFMHAVHGLLVAGTDGAEVSFNPLPTDERPRPWFVADAEGFLCGDCNDAKKLYDVADEDTQVWEFYSSGWLAPCVCGGCGLSLPVYLDENRSVTS